MLEDKEIITYEDIEGFPVSTGKVVTSCAVYEGLVEICDKVVTSEFCDQFARFCCPCQHEQLKGEAVISLMTFMAKGTQKTQC